MTIFDIVSELNLSDHVWHGKSNSWWQWLSPTAGSVWVVFWIKINRYITTTQMLWVTLLFKAEIGSLKLVITWPSWIHYLVFSPENKLSLQQLFVSALLHSSYIFYRHFNYLLDSTVILFCSEYLNCYFYSSLVFFLSNFRFYYLLIRNQLSDIEIFSFNFFYL